MGFRIWPSAPDGIPLSIPLNYKGPRLLKEGVVTLQHCSYKSYLAKLSTAQIFRFIAILVLLSSGALAQQSAPGDEQIKQRIREFVARTVTLAPLKDIQIVEFSAPDNGGLRKVVVSFLNNEEAVSKTFYVTRDNNEILEGTLQTLTPDPWKDIRAKLEPMIQRGPANGPAGAAVSVVEFSDFECPFCRRLNVTLEQLNKQHPSQIRWIFLDYPLVDIHPWARAAAIAGDCVAEQSQDKFWLFEPMIYEHQQGIKPETASEQLRSYALAAGAAPDKYNACVQSPEAANRVNTSIAQGKSLGVSGTPTLFVNGRRVVGGVSLDALEAAITNELELAQRNALAAGEYRSTKK